MTVGGWGSGPESGRPAYAGPPPTGRYAAPPWVAVGPPPPWYGPPGPQVPAGRPAMPVTLWSVLR